MTGGRGIKRSNFILINDSEGGTQSGTCPRTTNTLQVDMQHDTNPRRNPYQHTTAAEASGSRLRTAERTFPDVAERSERH